MSLCCGVATVSTSMGWVSNWSGRAPASENGYGESMDRVLILDFVRLISKYDL